MFSKNHIIGKGSFGNVFLNSFNHVTKNVKLIDRRDIDDPDSETEIVYSTIRELAFLSCFRHKNIANLIYKYQHNSNEIDICLWNGGKSLAKLMQTYSIKKRASLLTTIAYQVLKVLQFLEVNGITHSDIKPSNIVMDDDKHVRVIDWGGVCFKSGSNCVSLCSTKTFRAPEQRSDISRTPETGCFNDVFSFGLTMFCFLFNKQPGELHFTKKKKIDLLKVFDIELEEFCELEEIKVAKLLLTTLEIDHHKRPKASQLIISSVFDDLRNTDNYQIPKPKEMDFSFMNKTDDVPRKLFQKKLVKIMDYFNLHHYNVYANMLFQMFYANDNARKILENKDYKTYFPQFCIDLCIILFDDNKDGNLEDFDEYDFYFEIRNEMIRKLLNAVSFNIYKKL